MPKLSDTMEYGILLKWYKKVGDPLRNGDILAEVETDKATLELENFDDGVLSAIYANEGDQVAVGAPLALVRKVEKEFRISENFSAPIQTDLSKFKTSRIYLTRRSMVYGPYSKESIHQFLDIGLCKTHEYAWAPHMNKWSPLSEVVPKTSMQEEKSKPVVSEVLDSRPFKKITFSEKTKKIWKLLEKDQLEFALELVLGDKGIGLSQELSKEIIWLESSDSYSSFEFPSFVDPRHGMILFLVCLGKLASARKVPPDLVRKKSFILDYPISLRYLEPLRWITNLRVMTLNLEGISQKDFQVFKHFPKLTKLIITNIEDDVNLDFLDYFDELEYLVVDGYDGSGLDAIFRLSRLRILTLRSCKGLKVIKQFSCVNHLVSIELPICSELIDVSGLRELTLLEKASFSYCLKLADISPLSDLKNLGYLNLSHSGVSGPIPEWIHSIESVDLGGTKWQLHQIGKRLMGTKIAKIEVEWNGSGDDGYFEHCAYDAKGKELKNQKTREILGLTEEFVLCKLPRGAEIDGGSYGLMSIDVFKNTANWNFHWRDGLQFFRDRVEQWSKFEKLRFLFGFKVDESHSQYEYLSDTQGNWQWCFDEYNGPIGLVVREVSTPKENFWKPLPVQDFLVMERMLQEWTANVYFYQAETVLKEIFDNCKDELPDYLLDLEMIVDLDCTAQKITFEVNGKSAKIDLELEEEHQLLCLKESYHAS